MMQAIFIKNLNKNYAALKAVDNLSMDVKEGDFIAFLGPNGAGKTTTIHCITGLNNFQSGSIQVFGNDVIKDYRVTRRLIGLCPQEFNLDPFLSIEQTLTYQAGYFGIPKKEAKDKALSLLNEFGLYEKRTQDFRKLSGGMKRRLLLCRALVHDPKILILDEPTAGADLEVRHQIWDTLLKLNSEGRTIFLTTHYMEEAEKLSKTIAIIHHGQLIHQSDKQSLLQNKSLEEMFLKLTKTAVSDEN